MLQRCVLQIGWALHCRKYWCVEVKQAYSDCSLSFGSVALDKLAGRKAIANLDIDTLVHIVGLEQRC